MSTDDPVVPDTGPLIHLGEADALDLLEQFDTLLVPKVVYAELRAGEVPEGFECLDHKLRSVAVDDEPWPTLDPGETAALTLCQRNSGMLLTDDLDARQKATEISVEVHGSLGVVLAAYADDRIDADEARRTIRALERESTLYLSRPLVQRAIDRLDDP